MRTVDVIVVGGGPAGSSTAAMLTEYGLETLVFDRHQAGWQKPCGGYLPVKIFRRIHRQRLDGVNLQPVNTVHLLAPGHRHVSTSAKSPIGYMVQRAEFDAALLGYAARGARVERGVTVRELYEYPDYVEVVTDQGTVRTRYVVGADGVHSSTARASGIRKSYPRWQSALAYVAHIRWLDEPRGWSDQAIELFCYPIAAGMGWAFPLPGGANIGVAGIALDQKQLALNFEQLLTHMSGRARFNVEQRRAWFLPAGGIPRRIGHGRVLLAGDAAGFVDCFCGEGIHYAVHSGQLAAHAVSVGYAEPREVQRLYRKLCRAEIIPSLRSSLLLSGFLWRNKAWYHRALQHRPELATHLLQMMRSEQAYKRLMFPLADALLRTVWPRPQVTGEPVMVWPAENLIMELNGE